MYIVYLDSGTSNTRMYLLRDRKIVDYKKKAIGSKDSSIAGTNTVLIKGLYSLYNELLAANQLCDDDIDQIYASGLVTSPFGFKDVPHICTPVSRSKLYENIYEYYESIFFNREISLIRGVKTISEDFIVTRQNIHQINNMRGEEIEIFGILSEIRPETNLNLAIFLPGSHTHIAYIQNRILKDIISTFSGELFHAISQNTILSGSIDMSLDKLDEEMVLLGFQFLEEYGMSRALYLVNTMQIFSSMIKKEKTSYLSGVIVGGVIISFLKTIKEKWSEVNEVIVAGDRKLTTTYNIILKNLPADFNVTTIEAPAAESFAVKGFLELLKEKDK